MILPNKDDEARRLAQAHYKVEVGITKILRITGAAEVQQDEPIKLLEVNENTVPSGVMPLYFGPLPSHGYHFPSIIVEVTPEEFAKIRSNELKLPDGWQVGEVLPREEQIAAQ